MKIMDSINAFLAPVFSDPSACIPYDDDFLKDFLRLGPLHAFIPTAMGGKEESALDAMRVMESTAYHSLPLGLTLGITGSLFVRPMVRLASEALRQPILNDFLKGPALGGMMITEPTGGTDIFGLKSGYSVSNGQLALNGRKCWGGLTGRAEHWLVAARQQRGDQLSKRVALIYVPLQSPGMRVDSYFEALGLQPIPYGLTVFENVNVPEINILTSQGRGALREIYDILFRSRLVISSLSAGHCRRLLAVCEDRTASRLTGGHPIGVHDQVQYRLSEIRATEQVSRALWNFGGRWMDQRDDLSSDYLLVNAAKIAASEGMALASDTAFHLFASAAFKRTHLVGRAYTDVRPFRIFEGVNDVLNENTFDVLAGREGIVNLERLNSGLEPYGLELRERDLPQGVCDALAVVPVSQRQRVAKGELLAWLTAFAVLHHEGDKHGWDIDEGHFYLCRRLASRAAELPFLGA